MIHNKNDSISHEENFRPKFQVHPCTYLRKVKFLISKDIYVAIIRISGDVLSA